MPMAMTRVFILPVGEVGAISDGDLYAQMGELLSELGLWRHIERIENEASSDKQ